MLLKQCIDKDKFAYEYDLYVAFTPLFPIYTILYYIGGFPRGPVVQRAFIANSGSKF